MKRLMQAAVVMLMGWCSVCSAGTLKYMENWGRVNENIVMERLAAWGITNSVDCARIARAWDEDTLVDLALANRAYELLGVVMPADQLSAANLDRIGRAVQKEQLAPALAVKIAMGFPVGERGMFSKAIYDDAAKRYPLVPEMGRVKVKYEVLEGKSPALAYAGEEDLIRVLVAPEQMDLATATQVKKSIKDKAIAFARAKLRAEGDTFVVKDGVNPLAAKVQPVVTALNAPECAGLEAAMRELGSAVPDVDRRGLGAKAGEWRGRIMLGEMIGTEAGAVLGKVSVALGAEGYNRFVDEYNNGAKAVANVAK